MLCDLKLGSFPNMTTPNPAPSPADLVPSVFHLWTGAGGAGAEPGAVRASVLTRAASRLPPQRDPARVWPRGVPAQHEVLLNALPALRAEFARVFRRISLGFFQKFTAFFGMLLRSPL